MINLNINNFANKDFKRFVDDNLHVDAKTLALKWAGKEYHGIDVRFAITQVACLEKIRNKLPEIYNNRDFLFARTLAAEQCTAQQIAMFHGSLFGPEDNVLDLTCGLGIDTLYIAHNGAKVTTIDIDQLNAQVAAVNFRCEPNITVLNDDSTQYIKSCDTRYTAVFIDPARRDQGGARVYGLRDCSPDVLGMLEDIKLIAPLLYIKMSPMLDITQILNEMPYPVADIWVTSIDGDCKEIFAKVLLNKQLSDKSTTRLHAMTITEGEVCEFSTSIDDSSNSPLIADPSITGKYLCVPDSAIIKARLFAPLCDKFGLRKLAENTHLFVTDKKPDSFAGRVFHVDNVVEFHSKEIKRIAAMKLKANVAARNFPLTSTQLQQRLRIKDGGETYLFGATIQSNPYIIFCSKA